MAHSKVDKGKVGEADAQVGKADAKVGEVNAKVGEADNKVGEADARLMPGSERLTPRLTQSRLSDHWPTFACLFVWFTAPTGPLQHAQHQQARAALPSRLMDVSRWMSLALYFGAEEANRKSAAQ